VGVCLLALRLWRPGAAAAGDGSGFSRVFSRGPLEPLARATREGVELVEFFYIMRIY
jgi:hypothetical protein